MRSHVFVAGLSLALSSCATPYQEMGLMGGVSAAQVSSDTFQISVRGNGFTDHDMVERYALRKAAEVTLAGGFDLFQISSSQDRSLRGTEAMGSASGYRGIVWGTSTSWETVKPGQTLWVRGVKYPKPEPMPAGMYDAREVLKYLAPPTADSRTCSPGSDGKIICR